MTKKKILLIDDEVDFTELAGTLLGFHGFEVETFNNPKLVLKQIQNTTYDLIVTDLMMPDMNGFELIQQLRVHPQYEKVPLIVLSAKTLTDEERKFLLQNDVHYFMKPFDPQGLVEHIRKRLQA